MIEIYNDKREIVISTEEYENLEISRELNNFSSVSFSTTEKVGSLMTLEGYVKVGEEFFTIKELSFSSYYDVTGQQDLEDLNLFIQDKDYKNRNLTEVVRDLVLNTGWTSSGPSDGERRDIKINGKGLLDAILDCANILNGDVLFDSVSKTVLINDHIGGDKGAYFHSDLNLKTLSLSSDSYDFATRLIPLGKDGLTISSVNNGRIYLEDKTYSDKTIVRYWEDNRYTIPKNLLAAAEERMEEYAKPVRAFSCDVVDLASLSKYSFMDFNVGDTITLVDKGLNLREKHKITTHTFYPDDPHRGNVTFENKPRNFMDRFEDKYNDFFESSPGGGGDDFDPGYLEDRLDSLENRVDVLEDLAGVKGCTIMGEDNSRYENGSWRLYFSYDSRSPCIFIPPKINGSDVISLRKSFYDYRVNPGRIVLKPGNKVKDMSWALKDLGSNSANALDRRSDLSDFDTGSVINMDYMFADSLTIFSDNINLDTSKVESMEGMFYSRGFGPSTTDDNEFMDLRSFDTSNVTTMSRMFMAASMNTDLLDISSFDTSKVEDMSSMFEWIRTNEGSIDISNLNTSSVVNFDRMFANSDVGEIIGLDMIDTSNADSMVGMFSEVNIGEVGVDLLSNNNEFKLARDSSHLFSGVQGLANFDTNEIDMSRLDVATGMFAGADIEVASISGSPSEVNRLFNNCTNLKSAVIHDVSNVSRWGLERTFSGCTSLESVSFYGKSNEQLIIIEAFKDTPNLTGELDLSMFGQITTSANSSAFAGSGIDSIIVNGLHNSKAQAEYLEFYFGLPVQRA